MVDLIPAYALGALDENERAEVETWLRHDRDAQRLLAEYQAMTGHLVALAPLKPVPERLQNDLHRRVAASEKPTSPFKIELPPVVLQPGGPAQPAPHFAARRATWVAAAVAAVLLVALVGVILLRPGADGDTEPAPGAGELYARLSTQPDAHRFEVVPGEVDTAVSGDLVVSATGDQAVIRVFQLPDITSDQVFQLWLIDEAGTRTSGGLFQADQVTDATYIQVPLEHPLTAYQGFGVSLEPAGGSPFADQPTGPRVFSIPLSS